MSIKSRLSLIEKAIESDRPEQFIMAHERDDGLEIMICSDAVTGKKDKQVYNKVMQCKTADELREATKGEKVKLIIISARKERPKLTS
jgi:hypothetical protein